MRRRIFAIAIALLVGLGLATPSRAVFHETVIDEMLTSYGGDPNVQFIEMRMLASLQSFVGNSVFAAFDSTGTYTGDILVVPNNVAKSGSGTRWLVGTMAFQTATGLAPDFIMQPGVLPTGGGMVCFGGGGGLSPKNPPTWDRTNIATYVDCVAYGTFSGSGTIVKPTSLNGDGHSLQRMGNTMDNAANFICADPATPQNNAGATASMAATDPCASAAATATATPTSTQPAPTMTPVPPSPTTTSTPLSSTPTQTSVSITSPTPTATGGPTHPCTGDCNGDSHVNVNELIVAVNIALGSAEPGACPAFGGAKTVTITDLIRAVNDALNGCPATPTPT